MLTLLTQQDSPNLHRTLPRIFCRQLRFWGWTRWCALNGSKQPRRLCTSYTLSCIHSSQSNQLIGGRMKEKDRAVSVSLGSSVFTQDVPEIFSAIPRLGFFGIDSSLSCGECKTTGIPNVWYTSSRCVWTSTRME